MNIKWLQNSSSLYFMHAKISVNHKANPAKRIDETFAAIKILKNKAQVG